MTLLKSSWFNVIISGQVSFDALTSKKGVSTLFGNVVELQGITSGSEWEEEETEEESWLFS